MSRRFWLVTLSIAAHGVTAAAVLVAGMWDIERLERDRRPVALLAVLAPPPAPAGGGLSLPEVQLTPKERPKRTVKELVQPIVQVTMDKPVTAAAETTGGGTGTGVDEGPGSGPGGDPDGTCFFPPCGDDPAAKLPPVPPPPEPETQYVPPLELVRLRISGETQIQPPMVVKHRMRDDGKTRVVAVIEVCISGTGAIASTRLLRSTRYPEYDAKLLAAVRAWRYKANPAGARVKLCSPVTFQYQVR